MIPLHVLTGFLGSGKTTLLARLLQAPSDEKIAVLVNEAGDLGLDPHLIEAVDEDVLSLASGCVCCTLRGDLYAALERIQASRPARIVLETTGLADPAPILHGLADDARLAATLRVAGVIAVVDASRIELLLDTQPEVQSQLAFADRIVLTHGDLVPERLEPARERLAREAPGRALREGLHGAVERDWLLAEGALAGVRDAEGAHAWLHHGPGAGDFRTHSVELPTAARIELVQLWLRLVCQMDGPRVLRIKLLVECAETGQVHVLQSAQRSVSPPRRLARPPRGFRGVQGVVIERGLSEPAVRGLLAALGDAVRARAPAPGGVEP